MLYDLNLQTDRNIESALIAHNRYSNMFLETINERKKNGNVVRTLI